MTQPNQPAEQPREWVFTFGNGNYLPDGTDALGYYVAIIGTFDTARAEMVARHGIAWCDQYSSRDRAGVNEFSLTQFGETITATAAGPVDRERVLVEAAEPAIYAEILHRLPTGVEGTGPASTEPTCPQCPPDENCQRGADQVSGGGQR